MATITGPDLIIADEPTTALDVTVQAQILEILRALKTEKKTAIAMVSHDMGVIAGLADRVQVMRHGKIVESGTADDIFYAPKDSYTRMLLDAIPKAGETPAQTGAVGAPLLTVDDLKVSFPIKDGLFGKTRQLRAVDGVSFTLHQGETLGVVGESGCGKSTLARAVLQLLPKTGGRVVWLYAAHNPALKAGAAWYGPLAGKPNDLRPKTAIDLAARVNAPVLGLYAGQDHNITAADIDAMRAALAKAGKTKSRIDVFDDAQHGFNADYRDSYNEKDAKEGWARMLAWFKANGV